MVYKLLERCARRIAGSGWLALGLFLCLALVQPYILHAGEYRHHEAHEHGTANLNIALEGNNLFIEFTSPAVNIVGFEHHPRTQAQKDSVKDAVRKLQSATALFVLSAGSDSHLLKHHVHTDIDEDAAHHTEHEHESVEKGQHGQEEHHHKKLKGDAEHERHSEFKAEYHFICKNPDRLLHIDVMLFRIFAGIEHIDVQLLSGTKQTAMVLTANNNKISL